MVSPQDVTNPNAIVDYLEEHFKEKVKNKKQRKMMGMDENELESKIRKMEEDHTGHKRKIDVKEFEKKREVYM